MNKKKMLAAIVASLGIATVVGVGTVAAQEASSTSLAEQIATKFNLNKDEVQQVIDENHEARHEEMEKRYEERLQEAVDVGNLTVEQKDKLIAKMEELQNEREVNRETMRDKTREERREVMEQKKAELEAWAQDNGIPTEYLAPGPGGRGHGPHGMHGMGR